MDGILVERYVAGAHYNKYKGLGMELGTLVTFPYNLGMQAPSFITGRSDATCAIFKKCIQDILDEGQLATVGYFSPCSVSFVLIYRGIYSIFPSNQFPFNNTL